LTKYGERPGDSTTCYEVDPVDLCSALSGMPISTGLLPPHCVWYSYQGGVADLGIHVLPRQATLTLTQNRAGPRVYRIPLPGLIWAGQGDRYRVFAVRDRQLTADTQLYRAPLPNVYVESGSVCPGSVQFPNCTAQTIMTALRLFLDSHFNNHLIQNKSVRQIGNILDLWAELDGRQRYPYTDLLPHPRMLLRHLIDGEFRDVR
ncbi:MAG: prokaryotic E2 ligase family D protein, partial [Chloroflexi bacterium]|nr:prokaryotic E2 ligase family D protein [Chloroflexota bacterium]